MPALVLAAAAALHFAPPRLVGDWYYGCDNGRYCTAAGLQPEAAGEVPRPLFYALTVSRSPAALDRPRLAISVTDPEAADREPDYRLELLVDGRATGLWFSANAELVGDSLAAARALAVARKVELRDVTGKAVGRLSLNGAAQALRAIDRAQHRTGTVTAIALRGAADAGHVPPPPTLPKIARPPIPRSPVARLSRLQIRDIRARYDCGDIADTDKPEFHRLDALNTLAIIPCSLGAYQSDAILLRVSNRGTATPAAFDRPFRADPAEAPDPANDLVSAEFDSKTGVLRSSYEGRGLGDCGGDEAYVWDGARFRLAFQEVMDQCRGSFAMIPLWRTANVSAPPPTGN